MNWKEYEREIVDHFKSLYPESIIKHDQKLPGKLSKTKRQIDILIKSNVAGFNISIVIDCKYFNKKIDVKIVEAFISMLHDLKINKGVIITNKGFSKSAILRAENDSYIDLELKIIEFKDLHNFRGFGAVIHRGPVSCFIESPPEWIIDGKTRDTNISLAYFYPAKYKYEKAIKNNEFIITNIVLNIKEDFSLNDRNFCEKFIKSYNDYIFASFKILKKIMIADFVKLDGNPTIISKANLGHKNIYTVFADYGEYVIYFTMHSPKKDMRSNLKILKFIVSRIKPFMATNPGAPLFHQLFLGLKGDGR